MEKTKTAKNLLRLRIKGINKMKSFIRIVMVLCAITVHFALSGCGSGGSGEAQNAGVTTTDAISSPDSVVNSYSRTEDAYGLNTVEFMSTETNNTGGLVLRASNLEMRRPIENPTADIFRIDIMLRPSSIIINSPYTIVDNNEGSQSSVDINFFNGNPTSFLHTKSGTITFTSYGVNSGDVVAGSFDVLVENQDPNASRPTYSIKGNFSFVVNSPGSIPTAPTTL
jgi:hypothetical protein